MFEWLAGTNPKSVDVEVRKPALGKLGNATESIDIGGLVYGAEEWSKNEGKATRLNVHGTYLVGPMRPPMVMMDGSTLDFSVALLDLAEVYESTNDKAEDCTTPGELLFADGATINVKFGDRAVSSKEPIIAWAAMPANIDGVKFESVPGEKKRSFVKKDDGLYAITRGFSILVR